MLRAHYHLHAIISHRDDICLLGEANVQRHGDSLGNLNCTSVASIDCQPLPDVRVYGIQLDIYR
jgi:hypothetical protein